MTTETSIYEYAKQGLALSADKPAIWFYGKSITYRELFEKIDNVADHLYALGVREGTVVTIHLPNCPQAVMAIYAVAKLGGICNMVHALTPEAALRENMAFTESQLLITHLTTAGSDTINVEQIADYEETCDCMASFPEQLELSSNCAFYLHSSGTTGEPKTVILSHRAINNCVKNTAEYFAYEDVTLAALPMSHVFGLTMDMHRNISLGSKMVLMSKWDSALAVKLISEHHVSAMLVVPKMCYALLNEAEFSGQGISQLVHCYVGGDMVDPQLVQDFDNRIGPGYHLFPGFGMTETTINCVNRPAHYRKGSIGYPMTDTELAVLDDEGALLKRGKGELLISSDTLMSGYLKDPDSTEKALVHIDGKQWLRTGDLVFIDNEGYLFYIDRLKNIIIHNGNNIYPGDVEAQILTLPCVEEACAVGVSDGKTHSEEILAAVVLKKGTNTVEAEMQIQEVFRMQLPKYAIPKYLRFVDKLPVTSVGKVDRAKIRVLL